MELTFIPRTGIIAISFQFLLLVPALILRSAPDADVPWIAGGILGAVIAFFILMLVRIVEWHIFEKYTPQRPLLKGKDEPDLP
jgi:hypothetical protein